MTRPRLYARRDTRLQSLTTTDENYVARSGRDTGTGTQTPRRTPRRNRNRQTSATNQVIIVPVGSRSQTHHDVACWLDDQRYAERKATSALNP